MKTLLLSLLLLAVFDGIAQKKKKGPDPKDVQIDTLSKTNALLNKQLDSVTKDRALYYGLYTTIKEKVLLKDFDPAKFPQIVDSIRKTRDSDASSHLVSTTSLRDSLSITRKENMTLRSKVDSMSVAIKSHEDKTKLIAELKDLKSLLDSKIITQAEYDEKKKMIMSKWK